MTKLTANVKINMSKLDDPNALTVNFDQFGGGFFSNDDATQATQFDITGDPIGPATPIAHVFGEGFSYFNFSGRGEVPISGVVTKLVAGVEVGPSEQTYLTLEDFRVSVAKVGQVALSETTTDDVALVRQIFQRADSLLGSTSSDYLVGYDGADTIDGGAGGADTIAGGTGLDTVSYASATQLARVFLDGSEANTNAAKGDVFKSVENILGSKFNDVLQGDARDNVIGGGAGFDHLRGGGGADTFQFDTKLNAKANVDSLKDFQHNIDDIALDRGIFEGLTFSKAGVLATKNFYVGNSAHDADDRIIYNDQTGRLFYDADGNTAGGDKPVLFAIIAKVPVGGVLEYPDLTSADFIRM
jgi:Ca2+-binding RTX toxin-like protein